MSVQVFQSLLENNASEHGARMRAMDNATRNAGEMIDSLTLNYNWTRQAFIARTINHLRRRSLIDRHATGN